MCAWNKSWVPDVFDPCVSTSCQYIPFPPPQVDIVYLPDEQNSLSVLSEMSIYNPRLPLSMVFPGYEFCLNNGDLLLIVGEIPSRSKSDLEIIFATRKTTFEAVHFKIDIENDVIQRWGLVDNVTENLLGAPMEGTTIDYDEPFMIR